jgi:glycosyltransferase involved in cell wall biosynthesis
VKRKIRAAFVVPDFRAGGAQRTLFRLLAALDPEAVDRSLVVLDAEGEFRHEIPPGVPVRECGKRRGEPFGAWRRRLDAHLDGVEPDVAVGFLWFANAAVMLALRRTGAEWGTVLTEHSTIVGSRAPWPHRILRQAVIRTLYRRADLLVGCSAGLAAQLAELTRGSRARVAVLENPVEVDRLLRAAGAAQGRLGAEAALVATCLGRAVRSKGFDLAIRALRETETPWRLRIIGDGPALPALRRTAERSGVAGRVEFLGHLDDPFPALAGTSAFLLPSRYEGFPVALVEALALGLPCIATRCPTGPEEILGAGSHGMLVPVEDPAALAGALDRLASSEDLRRALGESGARRARDFDIAIIAPRFQAMLQEAAARSAARRDSRRLAG